MSNKTKKNDRLYQDALIWMGYRYAIGPLKAMRRGLISALTFQKSISWKMKFNTNMSPLIIVAN